MRHPLCTALCLSLAIALPAHGQTAPQTTLPHPPDHSVMLPLTTHVTYTHLQTAPDGTTPSQTEQTLQINDSQGRQLTSNTVTSTGITTTTVDDPIAGIRLAWNSSTRLAKSMPYAEPAVGRRSCWRLPPEEINPSRTEPQLGILGTTCQPAESALQPAYCKSQRLQTSSATDLPDTNIAPTSCTSLLQQQRFEDLGTQAFNGFLAQGCRTSSSPAQTSDVWAITLSSGTLGAIVQVHGVVDDHEPNQPDLKTTQDLTLLQVREPKPSTFQPPPDYALKTVDLHEVPCDQSLQP